MAYRAPLEDITFAAHDVLDITGDLSRAGVVIDAETIDEVISGLAGFCTGVAAPLNAIGDREGCSVVDGAVRTPSGFVDAARSYVADGWPALTAAEEHGGAGLPHVVGTIAGEILAATNPAWSLYFGLTGGAYRLLKARGNADQQARFLPQLAAGRWTGTMCLTEPHCGTDLGLLTTKATRQDDGTYRIDGTKMFISGGDNDFAENVVHLVLARIEGAPAGTAGISLFIVPRNRIADDGTVVENNGVQVDSIEHKMGMRGNATCVLRFEDAIGEIVGEENRGLAAMFVMMNGARLGSASQALGIIENAQQQATAYARDRVQSRAPGTLHDPNRAADPIIDQPDVRRMLLTQKTWAAGFRMLLIWLASRIDVEAHSQDADEAKRAGDLLALLTPVAKAFVTDRAVESSTLAMQTFGGAGYIVESGIEQTYRDGRILAIYEGTNGVQAFDLLARKTLSDDGARLRTFTGMVRELDSEPHGARLAALADRIEAVVPVIAEDRTDDPARVGASAFDFLVSVGHLAVGYFLARAAAVADAAGEEASAVARKHRALAAYFFDRLLPDAEAALARSECGTGSLMDPAALGA
ncbi:acyl-CoA dehydrogenase [Blastococcus sp. Marseille-P5729]|uniref:acyl-CoA dehydrogenase n=1 Tax=Blastococcus sp. Marseille-P5729 TaxID=2086582 RepID=UPI000D0E93CE|nr:acyl-CoA dehydrogenase [Blastococcus sp. Marseille-P5729]